MKFNLLCHRQERSSPFRIAPRDFNSFGSRRGNDAVMVRGTFNHVRLVNKLVAKRAASLMSTSSPAPATTTLHIPSNLEMDIFDASELYRSCRTPLIVLAGKDYGCGPSRDWVAKGPWMLVIFLTKKKHGFSFHGLFLGYSSCPC